MSQFFVAKSYENWFKMGEAFISNNKYYFNVKSPQGKVKTVRAYNSKEYKKLYGTQINKIDKYYKTQKEILGFTKGFVWIFKPEIGMDENNEYFRKSTARYHRIYGWYFISDEVLPEDLPADAEPVVLNWELVGNPNGKLKPEAEVEYAVGNLLYPPTEHEFNVSIGQRIELTLTVEKNILLENNYGVSNLHRMLDANGNVYIWITGAKNWAIDTVHHIRGTVKDTKEYKGEPQIILKNCREVIK